jgi:hypothetical protein
MKKIFLACMAVICLTSIALGRPRSETSFRLGIDLRGNINTEQNWDTDRPNTRYDNDSLEVAPSMSIGAEYLYTISNNIKLGVGLQYLTKRSQKDLWEFKYENFRSPDGAIHENTKFFHPIGFTIVPVYLTVQGNVTTNMQSLYAKGNFGINSFFDVANPSQVDEYNMKLEKTNGLYWGVALGYEFLSGWFAEIGYDSYTIEAKYSWHVDTVNSLLEPYSTENSYTFKNYSKTSLSVGYKFRY